MHLFGSGSAAREPVKGAIGRGGGGLLCIIPSPGERPDTPNAPPPRRGMLSASDAVLHRQLLYLKVKTPAYLELFSTSETEKRGAIRTTLSRMPKPRSTLLAGSLDFRKWESCRTMPLVDEFSRDLPFFPPFHSGAAPYSPQLPSSSLNTSLLRAAQISSPTQCCPCDLDNCVGLGFGWIFNIEALRPDEMIMEWRWNTRAGETGDPRENPQLNENLGATPPGIEPDSSWWEASSLTTTPLHLRRMSNGVSDKLRSNDKGLAKFALYFGFKLNFIALYILEQASSLHWLLSICEVTPLLSELYVIVMKERGKWEIPEKTRRPVASSSGIPTCGAPWSGIERDSSWWKAGRLTAQPLRPPEAQHRGISSGGRHCAALAASSIIPGGVGREVLIRRAAAEEGEEEGGDSWFVGKNHENAYNTRNLRYIAVMLVADIQKVRGWQERASVVIHSAKWYMGNELLRGEGLHRVGGVDEGTLPTEHKSHQGGGSSFFSPPSLSPSGVGGRLAGGWGAAVGVRGSPEQQAGRPEAEVRDAQAMIVYGADTPPYSSPESRPGDLELQAALLREYHQLRPSFLCTYRSPSLPSPAVTKRVCAYAQHSSRTQCVAIIISSVDVPGIDGVPNDAEGSKTNGTEANLIQTTANSSCLGAVNAVRVPQTAGSLWTSCHVGVYDVLVLSVVRLAGPVPTLRDLRPVRIYVFCTYPVTVILRLRRFEPLELVHIPRRRCGDVRPRARLCALLKYGGCILVVRSIFITSRATPRLRYLALFTLVALSRFVVRKLHSHWSMSSSLAASFACRFAVFVNLALTTAQCSKLYTANAS
ncbi:hypothetical protein PR048_015465 [Dryococelus australis]|uniref:Uncharacterized protein n=1 Tax=Dryococelus australis TaxID=614101 RepID=A0ABQ9HH10_9NEOP|nr:hypothetical protein PR048_015465 [Dryococelus australis]